MSWIKARTRLPGLFTTVEWRNHDGGDIPLGKATPLEHYQKAGANINYHEWLDESQPAASSIQGEEIAKEIENYVYTMAEYKDYPEMKRQAVQFGYSLAQSTIDTLKEALEKIAGTLVHDSYEDWCIHIKSIATAALNSI